MWRMLLLFPLRSYNGFVSCGDLSVVEFMLDSQNVNKYMTSY